MTRARWPILVGLALFALHNDFWLWNDARPVLGLPVGLFYHLLYTLVVAGCMALLVRFAWPRHLDDEGPEDRR